MSGLPISFVAKISFLELGNECLLFETAFFESRRT